MLSLLSSVVFLLSSVVLCCPWWFKGPAEPPGESGRYSETPKEGQKGASRAPRGNESGWYAEAQTRASRAPCRNESGRYAETLKEGQKGASRGPRGNESGGYAEAQRRASRAPCRNESGRYAKDFGQKGQRGGRRKVYHTT